MSKDEEMVGRIICEVCGSDLGPQQPLPNSCILCKRCGKWVDNNGKVRKIKPFTVRNKA